MNWIKVKIDYFSNTLEETKSKLINMFEEIGIKQIEVIDYFSDNSLDYNINFKKQSEIWSIIGYIVNNRFSKLKLNIISDKLKEFSLDDEEFMYEIYTSECSDDDWKDEWKKYFHTVNITDNIIIKPSWDDYEASEGETVIEIDPGMAFGTGTHETTALCVEFLEKYVPGKKKLLDIGCGSGILMLIGKILGVEKVVGIDIDSNVKDVVIENFEKNNIKDNYEIIIGDLVEDINKTLEKGATVIFSGIIKDKEEEFLRKTKEHNLVEIDRNEKNNWVSLVFKYN